MKTVHSSTLKTSTQERHPPSRIEKRILKQKSQESINNRDSLIISSSQVLPQQQQQQQQHVVQHRFRKSSSQSQIRDQSLPSPPATPKLEVGTKRFSTGANIQLHQQQQQQHYHRQSPQKSLKSFDLELAESSTNSSSLKKVEQSGTNEANVQEASQLNLDNIHQCYQVWVSPL